MLQKSRVAIAPANALLYTVMNQFSMPLSLARKKSQWLSQSSPPAMLITFV